MQYSGRYLMNLRSERVWGPAKLLHSPHHPTSPIIFTKSGFDVKLWWWSFIIGSRRVRRKFLTTKRYVGGHLVILVIQGTYQLTLASLCLGHGVHPGKGLCRRRVQKYGKQYVQTVNIFFVVTGFQILLPRSGFQVRTNICLRTTYNTTLYGKPNHLFMNEVSWITSQ